MKLTISEILILSAVILLLLIVPTLANAGAQDGLASGVLDYLVKHVVDFFYNLTH